MYLKRDIDRVLEDWSVSSARKPLILRGARQTGKTESIRHLSLGFELFLELNLERYEDLALVRASQSAEDLLAGLRARSNVASFPERTLLFLDEIQESPEAIQWLRFLREDHPDLAVIAAGSLLEVRLQERGFSFPVGRVTFKPSARSASWSSWRPRGTMCWWTNSWARSRSGDRFLRHCTTRQPSSCEPISRWVACLRQW